MQQKRQHTRARTARFRFADGEIRDHAFGGALQGGSACLDNALSGCMAMSMGNRFATDVAPRGMKRKQSNLILQSMMKRSCVDRTAGTAVLVVGWVGKVGAATAALTLIGILASPDVTRPGQPQAISTCCRTASV